MIIFTMVVFEMAVCMSAPFTHRQRRRCRRHVRGAHLQDVVGVIGIYATQFPLHGHGRCSLIICPAAGGQSWLAADVQLWLSTSASTRNESLPQ